MVKVRLCYLVLTLLLLPPYSPAEGDYNGGGNTIIVGKNTHAMTCEQICYTNNPGGKNSIMPGPGYQACVERCPGYKAPAPTNTPTTTFAAQSSTAQPNCPKPDGYCDTRKGEVCSNCPRDCDCYDLICMPGKVGATSWGCFNPCLAVANSVLNKDKQTCDCKKGYALNKAETDCVPLGCPPNSKMNADEKCSCDEGYSNCDGNEENGCETNVKTDIENCGGCSTSCPENGACAKGVCQCKKGFERKDGWFSFDCEAPDCPENSHKDDNEKCVCDDDYKADKKTGKCLPKAACNDNDICEPKLGETCADCEACNCPQDTICDKAIRDGLKTFPKVTDRRGCRDCETYCTTYKEHMIYRDQDGDNCFCQCAPGYDFDDTSGKCGGVKPEINRTIRKINQGKALTPCEFIQYLKKVEEVNPGKDWKQIASKMHRSQYPYDEGILLIDVGDPKLNVYTMREGKENAGFEDVNLLSDRAPKYLYDKNDFRIDIAHSYAGIRGGLNRNRAVGWMMAEVNTHIGDFQQIFLEDNSEGKGILKGGTFNEARKLYPPWQREGDQIGIETLGYLRDNTNQKLSHAYEEHFRTVGESC
jgi:hypothetical protein